MYMDPVSTPPIQNSLKINLLLVRGCNEYGMRKKKVNNKFKETIIQLLKTLENKTCVK